MDIVSRRKITNVVVVGKKDSMTSKEVKTYLKNHDIKISTFTLTGEVIPNGKGNVDVTKFGKYADLDKSKIVSIKYKVKNKKGEESVKIRKVVDVKTKKQPSKKVFDNQVSMYVYCGKKKDSDENKYVNVKVFLNGRVQLTGCATMDHCYQSINTINNELKKVKEMGDKTIKFVDVPEKLDIYNVQVRMINSNFDLGYQIQLRDLFKLLKKKNDEIFERYQLEEKLVFSYNPKNHTCVNIKYPYAKRKISIFVFGKGKIIITAAKKFIDIVKAHQFIVKMLDDYRETVELDVVPVTELNDIFQAYQEQKKKNRVTTTL
jgi:TATA-box binding protein (TBP) (component of TFIID and TFIIIB)